MYAPGRRWRPQEKTTNPSNNHLTIKKEYFIMKKVISLVLSVMMMLTMFAGCNAGEEYGRQILFFDIAFELEMKKCKKANKKFQKTIAIIEKG